MGKKLIAYFSCTGKTAEAARALAIASGADLFEIRPLVPYTKQDLNWLNKKSRSSVEMKDPTSRPAIATRLTNMEDYDTVFLGFPIWWYREPSIIDTFLEQYDFSGKTIILFITSGASGFGHTIEFVRDKLPADTKVIEGLRMKVRVSRQELGAWVSSLNL